MARKSVRENKTIYQISREKSGLTREAASEHIGFLTADRIDRIEREKTEATPEEVVAMASCYHDPLLCNQHCTQVCAIGKASVPHVELKELSQITLEMLASLNALSFQKERLIEITVDGVIHTDEKTDFEAITEHLDKMSSAIASLKAWVEHAKYTGQIES